MRYTLTFLEADFERLAEHLRSSTNETAAYIAARIVETTSEVRLLVRSVTPVASDDIESQSPHHLTIVSRSYVHAIKRAKLDECAFGFIHAHPKGPNGFSDQDDLEEPALFELAHRRNPQIVHFSLVASHDATRFAARIWRSDGSTMPVDVIRVVGDYWKFILLKSDDETTVADFFSRQVDAFGSRIQRLLTQLHIGVVGVGGTGSCVAEQLIRLGVGRLSVVDHDRFDDSNVNRVYGSSAFDRGIAKVNIAARQAAHIGLGTSVTAIDGHLGTKSVATRLRDCDIVFGCTDDQWGRSVLTRIAIYYLVPVIDLGVSIDPEDKSIKSVHGRVTILKPDYACLFCRERISADGIRAESIAITDPERAAALAAEGYIAGVVAPAPAVVTFTSAVASSAVSEFLDRLTHFKKTDRKSSEFVYRFEAETISRNSRPSKQECFCANRALWGAGDRKPFLGITWRPEQ